MHNLQQEEEHTCCYFAFSMSENIFYLKRSPRALTKNTN